MITAAALARRGDIPGTEHRPDRFLEGPMTADGGAGEDGELRSGMSDLTSKPFMQRPGRRSFPDVRSVPEAQPDERPSNDNSQGSTVREQPADAAVATADTPIIEPGRNCWRVARAERAAVLVDAASYFSRLEASLRQAKRSIIIVGWDFDGRIRLRPDADPEQSPPLGPLLRSLVEANPDLEVQILIWSVAVLHAPGAPGPLLLGTDWLDHPRLHLKLDTHHPVYAAHHQKIVTIDDRLAFVGGMDLTVRRWDTSDHAADDPHRLDPDGKGYDPVHDLQMVVDGEAAQAVAVLAHRRWKAATDRVLAPAAVGDSLWPEGLEPQFRNIPVAIARTMPAIGEEPEIREAERLTADALRAAKRSIYLEAQYLTAHYVGDILVEHLERPEGPDIVAVLTCQSRGLIERWIMGNNRDRLLRRLKAADRHGRLKVCYPVVPAKADPVVPAKAGPVVPAAEGERHLHIHAKLVVVDDRFLRVGSSNLNDRSTGLDTECDLAIEAADEATGQTIRAIRDGLIAEHLGTSAAAVAEALTRADGQLIRAIDALNHNGRGLRDFPETPGPSRPVLGTKLFDPKHPFEPLWFLKRKKPRGV
jgi:phosphatidylserine/phosphatidylglycerophosphate/cardiolipin synthase-like enzyme